jgi:hypothetical protein
MVFLLLLDGWKQELGDAILKLRTLNSNAQVRWEVPVRLCERAHRDHFSTLYTGLFFVVKLLRGA